jgi:hypothetical protein
MYEKLLRNLWPFGIVIEYGKQSPEKTTLVKITSAPVSYISMSRTAPNCGGHRGGNYAQFTLPPALAGPKADPPVISKY